MVMRAKMSSMYINLTKVFKKHISEPTHAHGLVGHGKYSKQDSNCKWTDYEYHVQDKKYVQHK